MIGFQFQDNEIINRVLINISIPEKNIERNIEWNLNETVESLKYYILKLLPDLEDPFNYGFFLPDNNGKVGKFLQEERVLNHYLIEAPFKLELQRKMRINFSNSSKLKKFNIKSNQKQFIVYIKHGELMKINKFLNNGLDPNFHVTGIPETPLTLACRLLDPHKIIMALVSNGAYLDFRASDSLTALHKVAKEGLYQPMKTLLQLGQSPNCKDNKGYTPLYYCIENDAPQECVNLLLYEHSIMGIRDEQGFQEIHKACLYGRTFHLDHLLTYGADIDAKTNKGNTALHICAVHNQGSCARLLLYRGITRYALDCENKSAYQTALLSNNLEIADLIQNFKDEDVVPVTTLPKFNEKRRSIFPLNKRFSSTNKLEDQSCDSKCSLDDNENINPREVVSSNLLKSELSISGSQSNDSQSLENGKSGNSSGNASLLSTWSSPTSDMKGNVKTKTSATSIIDSKLENVPRTTVLQKGPRGFGFVIKGFKNESEISSMAHNLATQYFDCIAEESPAFYAGLLTGDFLLEVNGVDVHEMPHESVVKVIQNAGDFLTLKIITVDHITNSQAIFDNASETKSNFDSRPETTYETGVGLNTLDLHSNVNGTVNVSADTKKSSKSSSKMENSDPMFQYATQKKLSIQLIENKEYSSQLKPADLNGKKPKFQAPPPPVRNDRTSLSIFQNNPNLKSFESPSKSNMEPEGYDKVKSQIIIPPPDYLLSNNIDNKTFFENQKGPRILNTDTVNSNVTFLPPLPPPPPPPPDLLMRSTNPPKNNLPINLPINFNQELSNISLKQVSQTGDQSHNNESNFLKNNHSDALKNAVLNHRKKFESVESCNIEEKLKGSKIGNKSMLFEASSISIENNAQDILPDPALKPLDFTDTKNDISKNPPTFPKPNIHISNLSSSTQLKSFEVENQKDTNQVNLRLKAESLRSNLMKKEQENKKSTLYFSGQK